MKVILFQLQLITLTSCEKFKSVSNGAFAKYKSLSKGVLNPICLKLILQRDIHMIKKILKKTLWISSGENGALKFVVKYPFGLHMEFVHLINLDPLVLNVIKFFVQKEYLTMRDEGFES